MPDILFQDGTIYHVEPLAREFEFQDNGDRWGNTMIRFNHNVLTIYDVIKQIAPQLLNEVIAVLHNDELAGLQKRVNYDCSLKLITLEDFLGREIAHCMYAFLIANYTYELSNHTVQILQYQYDSEKFYCEFITDVVIVKDALCLWLSKKTELCTEILFLDQYQKSAALDRFPLLVQPYSQTRLERFDEFDFLELSVLGNFALLAEFPIRVSLDRLGTLAQLEIEQDNHHIVRISGAIQ